MIFTSPSSESNLNILNIWVDFFFCQDYFLALFGVPTLYFCLFYSFLINRPIFCSTLKLCIQCLLKSLIVDLGFIQPANSKKTWLCWAGYVVHCCSVVVFESHCLHSLHSLLHLVLTPSVISDHMVGSPVWSWLPNSTLTPKLPKKIQLLEQSRPNQGCTSHWCFCCVSVGHANLALSNFCLGGNDPSHKSVYNTLISAKLLAAFLKVIFARIILNILCTQSEMQIFDTLH